jgi:predicted DCC family thiol-disulfide oxidoreductase YuxK
MRKDKNKIFRFIPLQSKQGADLLALAGPQVMQYLLDQQALSKKDEMPKSVILWMDNKPHIKSDGALLAIAQLGGIYRMAGWLRIIPRFIRDGIYHLIARNRYRWFGQRATCFIPGKGETGTGNEGVGTGKEDIETGKEVRAES